MKILKKVFGSRNDRIVRRFYRQVAIINSLEPAMQALSDEELAAKTEEFKQRLDKGSSLDGILNEAFAVVREASLRTLGLRHFDVQLIGGMVLHAGKVSEMRTGEGKTLVSTLPAYLNALTGKGVHIVTVNDYLAQRDADWMRPVHEFLGLSVGVNLAGMDHEAKQEAYACDITYGTNNEFGFDYLRDNMVFEQSQRVQRPLHYSVIDEVDSILIDEARTPLIISGQADKSSGLYHEIDKIIPHLTQQKMEDGQDEEEIADEDRGDYILDEKNKQAFLTDQGHQKVEELLAQAGILQAGESLYDIKNISVMHYVSASLKAHTLYQRDVHYVVKDNEVLIVDEHTGRLMDGRRWSDGLHQAVEAKENVNIQLENQTLATITFQNYFRLYEKLSGMTGTADTEAFELQSIYGLEVVIIPTNKPMVRDDRVDDIYLTQKAKNTAIIQDIKDCQEKQQPVLVGTASIENSELLSGLLKKEGIDHQILNAKQHEREALIIQNAGKPGAVTIATNMAGRGTDIVLGGNVDAEIAALEDPTPEVINQMKADWQQRHELVVAAGGLHVLGSERHESRRIDNQLRGRSGRQGDAGSSKFFLSMEDNLLRIFAADKMTAMMRKMGVQDDDVIAHPFVNRAIENAQRRVEGLNFDVRKQLLEYDDVANDQRKVIYSQRDELLRAEEVVRSVVEMREEVIDSMIERFIPPDQMEEKWDIAGLELDLEKDFAIKLPIRQWVEDSDQLDEGALQQKILQSLIDAYDKKEEQYGAESLRQAEKMILLQLLDSTWKDHLAQMDHLRQSIQLRALAQKNPKQEFKRESFDMFTNMIERLKYDFITTLSKVEIKTREQQESKSAYSDVKLSYHHDNFNTLAEDEKKESSKKSTKAQPIVNDIKKVGRNELCPCGSGKKYKHCHGRVV